MKIRSVGGELFYAADEHNEANICCSQFCQQQTLAQEHYYTKHNNKTDNATLRGVRRTIAR
jgi:hypothetical protein